MESRELIQLFEIRYSDGMNVYSSTCTPDILPGVIQQLMSDGKRIEEVKSDWR